MITPDSALPRPMTGVAFASVASVTAMGRRERPDPARSFRLGPLTLVETAEGGAARDHAALRLRRDAGGDWIIETSPSPAAAEALPFRMLPPAPGAVPQPILAEPAARPGLALLIPAAWRPGLTAALARGGGGALTGPAAELLALLLRETPGRLRRMDVRDETAVADVIAALIRASLPRRSSAEALAPDLAEAGRARVSRIIRENIGSARLDARRICALTGLSRSALYRLFEGESGVAAHIRAIRLGLVMDDLLDPALRDEPISAIAERRGFHCAASFNRTFRRAFGRTPSEARAAALSQGAGEPMRAAE
jgi:AraC-like DNA-binding protein